MATQVRGLGAAVLFVAAVMGVGGCSTAPMRDGPDVAGVEEAAGLEQPEGAAAESKKRVVAIVVFEGVELLDFAGPCETFVSAMNASHRALFRVVLVAPKAGMLTSIGTVTITPKYTIDDCPKPDIIVIPGGDTSALDGREFQSWLKTNAGTAEITMSVCNGALVLNEVGLLDGLRATTHWSALSSLRRSATQTTVVDDERVVDNGKVITTAGVSAGLDGALHVVARLHGMAAAERTARYMEYKWNKDEGLAKSYGK